MTKLCSLDCWKFLLLCMALFVLLESPLLVPSPPIEQSVPFAVSHTVLNLQNVLHPSDPKVDVYVPFRTINNHHHGNKTTTTTNKYPLLIFLHGFTAGGRLQPMLHAALLKGVASFGFVVLAPRSCSFGCPEFLQWDEYHHEALSLLAWAASTSSARRTGDATSKNNDGDGDYNDDAKSILSMVDHDLGCGVFGHSMGAQATIRALMENENYDIRAAVLLHPYTTMPQGLPIHFRNTHTTENGNSSSLIFPPMAFWTGTDDSCCGPDTTWPLYMQYVAETSSSTADGNVAATAATAPARAYAAVRGTGHKEPLFGRNVWSPYVAAWFRIFLAPPSAAANPTEEYLHYFNMIFGNDTVSLCGGRIPMDRHQVCEAVVK